MIHESPDLVAQFAHAQQRIHDLEHQLHVMHQLLDAVPAMVLAKGPQSRIQYANHAFRREYYGMTLDQLQNMIDAPFNEPDYTQQYIRDDFQVFTSGEVLDIPEEPVTCFDGTVAYFHTVKRPIRSLDGMIIGTVGVSENISQRKDTENALRAAEARMQRIIDNVPGMVYQFVMQPDRSMRFSYISEGSRALYHVEPAAIEQDAEIVVNVINDGDRESFLQSFTESATNLTPWNWEGRVTIEGQEKWLSGASRPNREANGDIVWDGLFMDVTLNKQGEAETLRLQQQIIDLQSSAIAELSTPLIQFTDQAVMMPLIGSIDTNRAQQVIETLLEGVVNHRARLAILDVTGVPVVDTQVASALMQAVSAARLLGAEVIVTGIRPEIAQTLVSLGTDMRSVTTYSNLQVGIAYALSQRSHGEQRPVRRF